MSYLDVGCEAGGGFQTKSIISTVKMNENGVSVRNVVHCSKSCQSHLLAGGSRKSEEESLGEKSSG